MTTPTYNPPLSYYVNLFTSQYKLASKLLAWFSACMQPISDINYCAALLNGNYNLDTAIGIQLDILGQIIGQSRIMNFQPSGSVSPILTDATYRILLYAKRGINTWNGKIASLYPLWQTLFPGGEIIVLDNQNMTATVVIKGTFSSIQTDLITQGLIVPRPEGVLYNYIFASNLPFFGADLKNSFIAGADLGYTT